MCDNITLRSDDSGIPIGQQIRHLRTAHGLSLAELARRAGTSAPSLHRYENGWDRFEVATLRRIAAAVGAHLEIRLIPPDNLSNLPPPGDEALVRLITPLFWDRDLESEHLRMYPAWVIGRVLMYGNKGQARAIRRFYGDDALRSAINKRGVDNRTRAFWSLVLGEDTNAPESS